MLMGNMGEIIVVESIESTFAALLGSNHTFVSVGLFRFYHLPCVVDCLTIPAISFWLTCQLTMTMTMTMAMAITKTDS